MSVFEDKPLYYRINKFEEFSQEFILVECLPNKYLTRGQAELKIKTLDDKYMYGVESVYWFDLVTIEE